MDPMGIISYNINPITWLHRPSRPARSWPEASRRTPRDPCPSFSLRSGASAGGSSRDHWSVDRWHFFIKYYEMIRLADNGCARLYLSISIIIIIITIIIIIRIMSRSLVSRVPTYIGDTLNATFIGIWPWNVGAVRIMFMGLTMVLFNVVNDSYIYIYICTYTCFFVSWSTLLHF